MIDVGDDGKIADMTQVTHRSTLKEGTGKTLAENSRGLYPIPRDGVTSAQRWCRYEEGRPKAPSSTYLGYSASLKVMKLARP